MVCCELFHPSSSLPTIRPSFRIPQAGAVIKITPIGRATTHAQIQQHFSFHGPVKRCVLLRDVATAYVEYSSSAATVSALLYDGTPLLGTVLSVTPAKMPDDVEDRSSSDEDFEKVEHSMASPPPRPAISAGGAVMESPGTHRMATETARLAAREKALRELRSEPMNCLPAILGVTIGVQMLLITAF